MAKEYPKEIKDADTNSKVTYKAVTVANPAAGANFSTTIPAGKMWEILSIHYHLVTSATVTSRYNSVTISDGTNMIGEFPGAGTQPENSTREITFAPRLQNTSNFFNRMAAPLMKAVLNAGSVIESSIGGILIGDQISQIVIYVKEIDIA